MWTESREQHVRRDADAEEPATLAPLALCGLLGPSLLVAGQRQRRVQGALVVAAVVDHRNLSRRGSHFPWELVTPDEVLAAELGGIHP